MRRNAAIPIADRLAREETTPCASSSSEMWDLHFQVYCPRKVWLPAAARRHPGRALHRRTPARPRVAPANSIACIKWITTTHADGSTGHPPDLVDRHFTATGPNQLWVWDFTYVAT